MYARGGDKFLADHAARRCHHPYSANRTTNKKAARVRGPLASSCAYVGAKKNFCSAPDMPHSHQGTRHTGHGTTLHMHPKPAQVSPTAEKNELRAEGGGGGMCFVCEHAHETHTNGNFKTCSANDTHTRPPAAMDKKKKKLDEGEIQTMRQHDTKDDDTTPK